MTVRRGQLVSGAVLAFAAGGYLAAAWGLPAGSMADPGPGQFPRGVGVLLALAAVGVLWDACRPRQRGVIERDGKAAPLVRAEYLRLAALVAACAGYLVLLPLFGLAVSAAGTAYLVTLTGGARRKVVSLAVAVVIGVAAQYLFVTLLHVPLPETPLGF